MIRAVYSNARAECEEPRISVTKDRAGKGFEYPFLPWHGKENGERRRRCGSSSPVRRRPGKLERKFASGTDDGGNWVAIGYGGREENGGRAVTQWSRSYQRRNGRSLSRLIVRSNEVESTLVSSVQTENRKWRRQYETHAATPKCFLDLRSFACIERRRSDM